MKKVKFSVIISHIVNDMYAAVLNAWEINEDGSRKEIDSLNKSGISITEAHTLAVYFIEKNEGVKNVE